MTVGKTCRNMSHSTTSKTPSMSTHAVLISAKFVTSKLRIIIIFHVEKSRIWIVTMALVNEIAQKKAYQKALKSLNECHWYDSATRIHYPKVCCLCDRFIMKGDERHLKINDLYDEYITNTIICSMSIKANKYANSLHLLPCINIA